MYRAALRPVRRLRRQQRQRSALAEWIGDLLSPETFDVEPTFPSPAAGSVHPSLEVRRSLSYWRDAGRCVLHLPVADPAISSASRILFSPSGCCLSQLCLVMLDA